MEGSTFGSRAAPRAYLSRGADAPDFGKQFESKESVSMQHQLISLFFSLIIFCALRLSVSVRIRLIISRAGLSVLIHYRKTVFVSLTLSQWTFNEVRSTTSPARMIIVKLSLVVIP